MRILTLLFFLCGLCSASDWPMLLHDIQRSGISEEQPTFPLHHNWSYQPLQAPVPAWDKPALQDYFNGFSSIHHAQAFNRAYHSICANNKVFFASSANDSVVCLDAASGKTLWVALTSGPIRLPPTFHKGSLYCGSDDGFVYCFDANTGALLWRSCPSATILAQRPAYLPGNKRIISRMPVRTGFIIDTEQQTIYGQCGLFPEEKVIAFQLDLNTGAVVSSTQANAAEGSVTRIGDEIYASRGRKSFMISDRTGKEVFKSNKTKGAGVTSGYGTLALTGGNERKELMLFDTENKKILAMCTGLRGLLLKDTLYLIDGATIQSYKIADLIRFHKEYNDALNGPIKLTWSDKSELKAQRNLQIENAVLWKQPCTSTTALIACGSTIITGAPQHITAFDSNTGAVLWEQQVDGTPYSLAFSHGRLFASMDNGHTLCFSAQDQDHILQTEQHDITAFSPVDSIQQYTTNIIKESPQSKGYCVIVNPSTCEIAYDIATRSDMHVLCLIDDEEACLTAQQQLLPTGLYGTRIHYLRGSLSTVHIQDYIATVIVSEQALSDEIESEALRIVRPEGGVILCFNTSTPANDNWTQHSDKNISYSRYQRGTLADTGNWSHAYGGPEATSCSNDDTVHGQFELQWFGAPGPEKMNDRHHRPMPPLYAQGKMFVLGNEYLYGVDAYNGTILWERPVPGSRRLGIMYDTAPMIAHDHSLFLSIGTSCIQIDANTGATQQEFTPPQTNSSWGFVDRYQQLLLGSSQHSNASLTKVGKINKLMEADNRLVAVSTHLFALDLKHATKKWDHNSGLIVNSTIVRSANTLCFLESRNPELITTDAGRFELNQLAENASLYFVALDIENGQVLWEKQTNLPYNNVFFLQIANDTLLASGSYNQDKRRHYGMSALSLTDGSTRWSSNFDEGKKGGSHGEQWQHPAIVGENIYLMHHIISLTTGTRSQEGEGGRKWRKGHGCGTISMSNNAIFYRGQCITDLQTWNQERIFRGNKPGCWINLIPAGGLLLMPEASAGCSCSVQVQTSMALRPVGHK